MINIEQRHRDMDETALFGSLRELSRLLEKHYEKNTVILIDEYFGFTDAEVRNLLQYYEFMDHHDIVKEWYDGYRFGNIDVYCPWDVLNYCDTLRSNPDASPQNYWINTSNNDAVRVFIEQSDNGTTKREIERMVAGKEIKKEIRPKLTYKDMYSNIDNLWSILYTTGYLTQRGRQEGNEISLVIPNVEIRNIFTSQIMEFFKEQVKEDGHTLNRFCDALERGDAGEVEQCFNEYFKKTISIRETFVKKPMKENFYHGILLGILEVKDKWGISSNRETGDGYSDIVVETENSAAGIILEIKYAHDGNLEESCKKALEQIVNTHYEEELKNEGIDRILKYGIACYIRNVVKFNSFLPIPRSDRRSDKPSRRYVSAKDRKTTPALGARSVRAYVPLRCFPSASVSADDTYLLRTSTVYPVTSWIPLISLSITSE